LLLDGFQAGLSWITILRKRDAFREAFENFDPEKIARWNDQDIERLMNNAGIVRNRAKITSSITSARAYLAIQEGQGFAHYLWDYVDGQPIQNRFNSMKDVPTQTLISEKLSKDLKKKGFNFCGPTIIYAFMQAVGMVNDHLVGCFRHEECAQMKVNL
jgi:DNA-3-methyladenine glycosylase I